MKRILILFALLSAVLLPAAEKLAGKVEEGKK